jgi:hypothetical protein
MQKLYASQLQTEAMKRQQLGTQMQREAMPVSQLLSQGPQTFGDIGYYSALVKGLQPPEYKPTTEAAAIRLKEAGRTPRENEASILSLPDTDPRKQAFISGKKQLGGMEGKNLTIEQLTARALRGDKEAQSILDAMQKRQIDIQKAGAEAKNVPLTPDSLDMYSDMYLQTGAKALEGLGFSQGMRQQIINASSKKAKERGLPFTELASNRAEYGAFMGELNRVEMLHGTTGVSMRAAKEHAATIDRLIDKKNDFGVPVIDRWFRAGKKAVAGDTDVTNLDAAIHHFDLETVRYLSSMTGGGQMSQQEAEKYRGILSAAMTPQQIRGGMKTIIELMNGKEKAFMDTTKIIKDNIKNLGKISSPSSSQSMGSNITTKSGKKFVIEEVP